MPRRARTINLFYIFHLCKLSLAACFQPLLTSPTLFGPEYLQKLLREGRGAERQGGLCRSNIYTSGRGEMTVKLCLVYDMYPQRTRRGKTLKERVCGKKALQLSYRRREPDSADEIAYGSRCRRNDLHTRLAVRKSNPHYASLALAGRLGVDGQIAPLV